MEDLYPTYISPSQNFLKQYFKRHSPYQNMREIKIYLMKDISLKGVYF